MKRCFQILFIFYTLLLSLKGQGQEFFLSNEMEAGLQFKPKDKKAIFFNIVGSEMNYENVKIEYKLPEGWTLTTATNISKLSVGEHVQPFFTFQVSENSPAGNTTIEILLKSNSKLIKSFKVEVLIEQIRKIEVAVLNRPFSISNREKQRITYLVRNTGNTEEEVSLLSSGDIDGINTFNLLAGSTYSLDVVYIVPKDHTYISRLAFDLEAYIKGTTKNYGVSISVPLLSSKTKKSDPFHRFPLEVGLGSNYLNDGTSSVAAFNFDINGEGFLDTNKKHYLELIARGPNQFELPRFGNINQYFIAYKNDKIGEIELGDNNFIVSELIEANRFSRGIRVGKEFGQWKASAMYAKPRFFANIKSELGASLGYELNKTVKLKLDALRKNHLVQDKWLSTNFASVSAKLNKSKYQLSSEASISITDNKLAMGFFNNFFLNLKKLKVTSNVVYTSKTYYGYYNNSIFLNNNASYPISSKLRFLVFQNLSQINPSLDTYFLTVAPYAHSKGAELSFKPSKKHQFRLNYSTGGREDRMEIKRFNFNEQLVRYFYTGSFDKFSYLVDGDFGKTQNLLLANDEERNGRQFRSRLNLRYQPSRAVSVSAFGEYLKTNKFSAALERNEFLFYGAQANVFLSDKFNMNLFYRNSYAPDELYKSQSFFDFSAAYRQGNHELSLNTSYAYLPSPGSQKNLFLSLKYTVNINTPLQKKKNLGHVRGRILGEKSEGVILNLNGQKILTDSTGHFSFNDLEPGNYLLDIEKRSIGFGNAVKGMGPVKVHINSNEVDSLAVEIVKTGGISGKVLAFKSAQESPDELESVLVELEGDGFKKLTMTDAKGTFNFSEIQAGNYLVRIKSEPLKKKYNVTKDTFQVSVDAGEDAQTTFLLEEKKRIVDFQENTIILSDRNRK